MGVNSLWDILGPTSRTVKLEALTRKRLAVDASIWIYQFLKAVRDSEGNTLQASHIVGFFRRICKLLYFGVLPIFVFDGGAPALKRETIKKRRERREGKSENATETAQRLLAISVQRQRQESKRQAEEDMIYFDDLPNQHPKFGAKPSPKKTIDSGEKRRFVPRDEYHLPELKKIRVNEADERLMPEEEFKELTSDSFDIVNGIDINTVDPKSPEFAQLPMDTQYMILSHLRLKSRLRMGFTKEQLEDVFPDSMDFSKFQIQQVQKRNFFTQKLMDVSGMGDEGNATKRIAGEKDRKYALVRTNDGWSLSLEGEEDPDVQIIDEVSFNGQDKFPIEVQETEPVGPHEAIEVKENSDSEDDFEDVPIKEEQEPEETPEDREFNKAIIESIYDQFSDKSESKTETKVAEPKKVDSFQEGKSEEADLGLNFGGSLLFSAPVQETKEPEKEPENHDRKEPIPDKEQDIIDVEKMVDKEEQEKAENGDENEKPKTKPLNTIPSWFNGDIGKQEFKPFSGPLEREDDKESDEDERAGLIPWNEAKEMIDEESDSDSDEIEIYEPETVEPETVEPETVEPETVEPETVEPETVDEPEKADKEPSDEKEPSEAKEQSDSINMTQEPPEPKEPAEKPAILDYVFNDDEEQLAEKQLVSEELDHEKLKQEITTNHEIPISVTESSITEEQLLQERLQKQKRDAEEVTQTMINDVQELLRRFGIPFITAPMEAEAQCAELHHLGLVDGIITDDSDCFLFGGDRIYKNMFNQKQYVECYLKEDVSHKLGLSQDRLIELGLLLGSDYTDGIKGIGPVMAMEILAEFGNLSNFKKWFDDCSLRGLNDNSTGLKRKLLTRIKNNKLYLSSSFPDLVVFDAYKTAQVDSTKEPFKWGVPDLDQIRSYLMYNVGWSQARVDEVMVPLIRDMNRKLREGTQSTVTEFFPVSHVQSSKQISVGKRMKAATEKLNKRNGRDENK